MKPFCLEKALSGSPVCTRDGREVSEIHYFKTASAEEYPLKAVIGTCIESYTHEGKSYNTDREDSYDLFLAPTKKTYWVNVYREKDMSLFCGLTLYEKPQKIEQDHFVGCYPITIGE